MTTDVIFRSCSRLAIVVAHPDDEIVGAAGQLLRFDGVRRVFHVTDGAPRDMRDAHAAGFASRVEYAEARRAEAHAALSLARLNAAASVELGVVDQEASLAMPVLARGLAGLLDALGIDLVVTHPYEGGHPDHDATALAVHAAVLMLARDGAVAPHIVEMTSYHAGPGGIRTGSFLQGRPAGIVVRLSREERSTKQAMLTCFRTQQHVLAPFGVAAERFRTAPAYDFTEPPHPGSLFYEHFDWGIDGRRWRRLASAALAALQVDVAAVRAARSAPADDATAVLR